MLDTLPGNRRAVIVCAKLMILSPTLLSVPGERFVTSNSGLDMFRMSLPPRLIEMNTPWLYDPLSLCRSPPFLGSFLGFVLFSSMSWLWPLVWQLDGLIWCYTMTWHAFTCSRVSHWLQPLSFSFSPVTPVQATLPLPGSLTRCVRHCLLLYNSHVMVSLVCRCCIRPGRCAPMGAGTSTGFALNRFKPLFTYPVP